MVSILDSEFLRALTEPARLDLLKVLLIEGPADINTIAKSLPQDRSVISRHLKLMERVGIVKSTWEGRRCIYEVNGPHFIATLEGIMSEVHANSSLCCTPEPAAKRLRPPSPSRR